MKSKVLFVLCFLAGLMFINAGLDKFFHYMPMPKDIPAKAMESGQAFMTIGWVLPLVGFAEVLGGLLLIFKKTRALGAIILVPILAGILLSTIYTAPQGLPIVLVLIAIVGWAIADNWKKYLPLVNA